MRLAVIVAAGLCGRSMPRGQGQRDFDYTSAGYMLFNNANDALQEFSKAIDRMQGLDLYIGRRERRHARGHTQPLLPRQAHRARRPERGGIWLIISESATMEIDTGRKAPGDEGAAWRRRYAYSTASTTAAAARRCAAPPLDTYTFNVPAPSDPQRRVHLCRGRQPGRAHSEPDDPLEGYSAISLGTLHERLRLRLRQAVLEVEIRDDVTYSARMSAR